MSTVSARRLKALFTVEYRTVRSFTSIARYGNVMNVLMKVPSIYSALTPYVDTYKMKNLHDHSLLSILHNRIHSKHDAYDIIHKITSFITARLILLREIIIPLAILNTETLFLLLLVL